MNNFIPSVTIPPTPADVSDPYGPVLIAGLVYALIAFALLAVAFFLPFDSMWFVPAALVSALLLGASLFCSMTALIGE